jgi:hypothetical protein
MRRVVIVTLLTTMCGCGSCLEDKRVPEADQAPTAAPVRARYGGADGGSQRRLELGPGFRFAGALPKDAGADVGTTGGGL